MGIQTGKFINQELSDYLKEYTSKYDRLDVATDTVSVYTLKEITYRNRTITEENRPVFIELVKLAVKNADSRIQNSTECKKDLLELLDAI